MPQDRSPVGRLFGAIVPRAVDAVDPDLLIERLDVDSLIQRVDVDALLTRIDIDALLARIDVDALMARIDVDALMSRVDVNGLISRVDLNALLATVDLNALMSTVDVKALVAEAGIDQIVAEATTGVAARTLDLARRQLVGIDLILLGAVDRVLRRTATPLPTGEVSATGRPAGPVSRLAAFLVDSAFVSVLYSLGVLLVSSLVGLFTGDEFSADRSGGPVWAVGYFAWWFVYLWVGLEIAGRSPGKSLVGLRVLRVDGGPLGPGKGALRTLVFPLSFVLGLGFIPAVVRRDRRALHDLIGGSREVVDWGDRRAELPSALEGWVERKRAEQAAALPEEPRQLSSSTSI